MLLQWDSDLEDDTDNDSIVATTVKRAQPKPVATVVKSPSTILDDTASALESLSINNCEESPSSLLTADTSTPMEVPKPLVAVVEKPVPKKAAAKKPAAKKPAAKKPVAKQAPANLSAPKKKGPAKKAVCVFDSSDEESDNFMGDDSDSDVEQLAVPEPSIPSRARSGRAAAQKVTYVIDSSDDDMSEEESDF